MEKEKRADKTLLAKSAGMAALVDYQGGAVVSRTIIERRAGTVTLFAFDKGQGLNEHTAPFDALVYVIDGEAIVTISGQSIPLKTGEANFRECREAPQSNREAAGLASDEVVARQLPREFPKKGERYEDRSVVVSLLRTTCPFCEHGVDDFQNCAYCGQHFVWANVPLDKSL